MSARLSLLHTLLRPASLPAVPHRTKMTFPNWYDWSPPPTLKYPPPHEIPSERIMPSGYVPPLGVPGFLKDATEEQKKSAPPFYIFRTEKAKTLPVYTDFRNDGRTYTILRRFRGDINELATELSKVCDGREVEIKEGNLRVKGLWRKEIVVWLTRMGF